MTPTKKTLAALFLIGIAPAGFIPAARAAVSAPSNFQGTPGDDGDSIFWSWSAVPGAAWYRVESTDGGNRSGDLPAGTVSWNETGLQPATYYTRRVVAMDASFNRATSGPVTVKTAGSDPVIDPPSGFKGDPASSTSIVWRWSDVSGERGYRVLSSNDANLSGDLPANTLSWTETGLSPASSYTRRVYAFNDDHGSISLPATASTPADPPPPPPAGFSGQPAGETSIVWSWSDVSGETGYRVVDAVSGANLSGVLAAGTASWTETGLAPGTTYSRRVVAFNSGGESASAVASTSTASPDPVLSTPPNFRGKDPTPTAIRWVWDDIDNERGYRVESPEGFNLSGDLPPGTFSWTENGLTPATSYTRRVVAFNNNHQAPSPYAAYSTTEAPDPVLVPPAGFRGDPAGPTSVVWSWSDVSGERGYRVVDANGSSVSGDLPPGSVSWTETALAPGATYTRRVIAFNNVSQASSANASATTPPIGSGLTAPPAFRGRAVSSSAVEWTWADVEGETGYRVESVEGASLSGDLPPGTTFWTETGLDPNAPYERRVTAYDALTQAASLSDRRFTLALPPAGVAVENAAHFSFTAAWSANGNPTWTSYQVDLTSPQGAAGSRLVSSPRAEFSDLAEGTTYNLLVRSVNGDGIVNGLGAFGTAATLPLPLAGQTLVSPGQDALVEFPTAVGPVLLRISSGTFRQPVTLTVRIPRSYQDAGTAAIAGTGLGIEILLDPPVQPSRPVTLELGYRDADVAGMDEDRLALARYDEAQGRWVVLGSIADSQANRVSAQTDHFSLFQVVQKAPGGDVSGAVVYPNPFRPALGHDKIYFDRLPAGARVRVYTLDGELVQELSAGPSGLGVWDAVTRHGKKTASGVYFALLEGAGGDRTLKVVIQR